MQPTCSTGPFELEQIVDAFTYDLNLRDLPYRYRVSTIKQLEVLRRANNYRPREYVAPDPFNVPIPAAGQSEYQLRVTPGSYIWAMQATAYDPATFEPINAGNVLVQIEDSCTGVKFFNDLATCSAFQAPQMRAAADTNYGVGPFVLPEMRLIGKPGHVNVILANADPVNEQYIQFVLFAAEPCEVMND